MIAGAHTLRVLPALVNLIEVQALADCSAILVQNAHGIPYSLGRRGNLALLGRDGGQLGTGPTLAFLQTQSQTLLRLLGMWA
jgi:hypothetical protein